MKSQNYSSIFVLTLLFFSCTNKEKKGMDNYPSEIKLSKSFISIPNPSIIKINVENSEVISPEDFYKKTKNINYIPLYTGNDPIGNLDKIIFYKDKIFVLDAFNSEKIYIFSMSGKLINTIDRKGQGPGEYIGLADMCISKQEDQIVLNDRLGLKKLYFTLEGKFLHDGGMFPSFYFEIIGNKHIDHMAFGNSYSDDVNYELVCTQNDSILRRAFPYRPLQKTSAISRSLNYNALGELLFIPSLSDTIYHIINDSTYKAKYVIEHGKSLWEKKDDPLSRQQAIDLIKNNRYTQLASSLFCETENYLSFCICVKFDDHILRRNVWYDKKLHKSYCSANPNKVNNPAFDMLYFRTYTTSANSFVGVITPSTIGDLREYLKQPNAKINDKNLIRYIMDSKVDHIIVKYEM